MKTQLTKQEFFTVVSKHLLKQMKQSKSVNDICQYHGPNGLKCALGCIIPEDRYYSGMEGKCIQDLNLEDIIPDFKLAIDLQIVHDDFHPDYWASELYHVANNHKLTL